MPRARTDVRRQCAVCSRSGRIASGITLRRLRGGASEALVPECRRCPPATVGALSGGTVAGETRRKGAQYSGVLAEERRAPLYKKRSLILKNDRKTPFYGNYMKANERFRGVAEGRKACCLARVSALAYTVNIFKVAGESLRRKD